MRVRKCKTFVPKIDTLNCSLGVTWEDGRVNLTMTSLGDLQLALFGEILQLTDFTQSMLHQGRIAAAKPGFAGSKMRVER